MIGRRRMGRETALQALYLCDISKYNSEESLEAVLRGLELDVESSDFSRQLVTGTSESIAELDKAIVEGGLFRAQFVFGMGVEPGAVALENVHEQQFSRQWRGRHVASLEVRNTLSERGSKPFRSKLPCAEGNTRMLNGFHASTSSCFSRSAS